MKRTRTTFAPAIIDLAWVREHTTQTPDGCWEWNHARTRAGYGVKRVGSKNIYLHRLVATLVYGESVGNHALHSCDNPPCCNPAHIRWGTRSDNSQDAVRRNRLNTTHRVRGAAHHAARLNEDDVREIRRMYATGTLIAHIAAAYGIHWSSAAAVVRNETWRQVK